LGVLLALASWLVIGFATLTPARGIDTTAGAPAACLTCDAGWGADLLANVLLFVPLGAGLALAGSRARRALVAIALTTLTIELLQLRFVAGRDASLRDLATNFVGGAAGYWIAARWRSFVFPRPALAAVKAAAWAMVWLAGTAVSGWAFTPSLPPSLWWAHWAEPAAAAAAPAAAGHAVPVVLEASLGGLPVAPGPVEQWPAMRPRLLDGGAAVVRAVIAPGTTASDAEIAVVDDADTEQDLIAFRRHGDGVAFYFRTRGAALRLRSPALASRDFLPATGGADTVRLAGAFAAGRLRVAAESASGPPVTRSLAVSPNWGWSFFVPSSYVFGDEVRVLTALWVATLVLPIAYWAARAGSAAPPARRVAAGAAVLAPAAGLWAIPALFHLPPVHWSEWLAWAAGTALGFALGRALTVTDGASVVVEPYPAGVA
jgi:hypothetical protein